MDGSFRLQCKYYNDEIIQEFARAEKFEAYKIKYTRIYFVNNVLLN